MKTSKQEEEQGFLAKKKWRELSLEEEEQKWGALALSISLLLSKLQIWAAMFITFLVASSSPAPPTSRTTSSPDLLVTDANLHHFFDPPPFSLLYTHSQTWLWFNWGCPNSRVWDRWFSCGGILLPGQEIAGRYGSSARRIFWSLSISILVHSFTFAGGFIFKLIELIPVLGVRDPDGIDC